MFSGDPVCIWYFVKVFEIGILQNKFLSGGQSRFSDDQLPILPEQKVSKHKLNFSLTQDLSILWTHKNMTLPLFGFKSCRILAC